jgi:hypothetical protein
MSTLHAHLASTLNSRLDESPSGPVGVRRSRTPGLLGLLGLIFPMVMSDQRKPGQQSATYLLGLFRPHFIILDNPRFAPKLLHPKADSFFF